MDYKDAGVNIDNGNELVSNIKTIVADTYLPGVLSTIGGFGSMFRLPPNMRSPILVAGTDGVGTKLLLTITEDDYSTIGIDLVAMCVNDIIVQGAKPLFFLDYYSTSKLDMEQSTAVINSIARGCKMAGVSLVGGETAEMPGLYVQNDYDLAGFCVGVVEEDDIIDGTTIKPDDVLLGLASSGPHANGYSLIRKIITDVGVDFEFDLDGKPIAGSLLDPTRIYVASLLDLFTVVTVKGLAHITGGGLTENIPRMLPEETSAEIILSNWERPAIFNTIQFHGNVSDDDMLNTFNCGIGMVLCIDKNDVVLATERLTAIGETVYNIGTVVQSKYNTPSRVIYV